MNEIETINNPQQQAFSIPNVIGSISFTIRDTECNSRIFGDCEICEKPAVQIFHQIRWKTIFNIAVGKIGKVVISDCYGHYKCLMELRK